MVDSAPRPLRTALLWILELAVAMAAWGTVWLRQLGVPGCGQTCDGTLLYAAIDAFFWVCVVIVASSGVISLLFAQHRSMSFVPVTGIVLIVIAAFVAHGLCSQALAP
ncbi:hypothetical protein DXT68_05895 [Microbacterium foliorum]|uniref:Uncharacterized protein n=1 Tax=Microbacterium foliorum TaxID=104336 RepID=A0A0F0KCL7_9MICO|nr:hypothetical protein [Microbacterium foliorum]AXL11727.1 hypothetical protein DXT68_05895 [Microbacterium foliorum]KJL18154.1 hypothetical protein RN50_03262 [Microbacterium foliorum]